MTHSIQREIGAVVGAAPGATLVIVAGIHGNEPAGIDAARRVLARLRGEGGGARDVDLRGELVVLAGNVAALRLGQRYLERDLNRGWTAAQLARLERLERAALAAEDREQVELRDAVDDVIARARGAVHLADLHTSSASGVPFVLFRDTPPLRDFVSAFPIPVISGILEQVEGVLSEHALARGCVSFSIEGGQHDAPDSRDSLEATIWLALHKARMVSGAGVEREVARATAVLDAMRGDLPRAVEVVSRHAISADDAFVMEQGFRNIDRIRQGQLLARDRRGEVRAVEDGVVVLPLYQKLGSDGFFWGRSTR